MEKGANAINYSLKSLSPGTSLIKFTKEIDYEPCGPEGVH